VAVNLSDPRTRIKVKKIDGYLHELVASSLG
jgi:hypothetical protein